MGKDPEEWLRQAEYDLETAETLLTHGRPQFAVFMCHLAVEKALKGLYHKRLCRVPPKIHNLIYFIEALELDFSREQYRIFARLNEAANCGAISRRIRNILRKVHGTQSRRNLAQQQGGHRMDKAAVLRILANYRRALEQYGIHADRIVLYGSFSHGTAREGSDIDVVIVSKDFEQKDSWQRVDVLAEAICDVREPIEAIGMTPAEWESGDSLIAEFAKQGELIYAA